MSQNDPQYDISKPYCFFDDLQDNINDVIMECDDFVNSNFVYTTNIIHYEDFEESLEIYQLNDVYKDSLYLQHAKEIQGENYKESVISNAFVDFDKLMEWVRNTRELPNRRVIFDWDLTISRMAGMSIPEYSNLQQKGEKYINKYCEDAINYLIGRNRINKFRELINLIYSQDNNIRFVILTNNALAFDSVRYINMIRCNIPEERKTFVKIIKTLFGSNADHFDGTDRNGGDLLYAGNYSKYKLDKAKAILDLKNNMIGVDAIRIQLPRSLPSIGNVNIITTSSPSSRNTNTSISLPSINNQEENEGGKRKNKKNKKKNTKKRRKYKNKKKSLMRTKKKRNKK